VRRNGEPILVVRSSPRFIAPDWRERIRQTPAIVWVLVVLLLISFGLFALRIRSLSTWGIALVVWIVLLGGPIAATAVNSRVVITPDYVESRDALRRSHRCERSILAAWVLGQKSTLKKVLLVDREGRTQLSLAWDAYSDAQLDQIRRVLGLPIEIRG
jgi:hypothetical protein